MKLKEKFNCRLKKNRMSGIAELPEDICRYIFIHHFSEKLINAIINPSEPRFLGICDQEERKRRDSLWRNDVL